MQIKTFTSFWSMEKKLYSINDISLPFPISLRLAGVFILTAVPWWLIMGFLHVPFSPPIGYLLWLIPPAAVAYLGSRPVFEGKTLFQFARSRIGFLFESARYNGLRATQEKENEEIQVDWKTFTRPSQR